MLVVPPSPVTAIQPQLAYFIGIIGLLGGLVLLLAGWVVDRVILAMAGAVLGALLAWYLGVSYWMYLAVPFAVVLAGVFVLSGRMLWALTGSGLVACLCMVMLAVAYWPGLQLAATTQPASQPQALSPLGQWAASSWELTRQALLALWGQHTGAVLWTVCLGGGMPLVVALLLPRLARILMTCVVGSVALVGGAMLMLAQAHPGAWPDRWALVALWGVLAVVLMIGGIIHQYYRAMSKPPDKKAASPPKAHPKPAAK